MRVGGDLMYQLKLEGRWNSLPQEMVVPILNREDLVVGSRDGGGEEGGGGDGVGDGGIREGKDDKGYAFESVTRMGGFCDVYECGGWWRRSA